MPRRLFMIFLGASALLTHGCATPGGRVDAETCVTLPTEIPTLACTLADGTEVVKSWESIRKQKWVCMPHDDFFLMLTTLRKK